jgi:hypothetical protein
MDSDFVSWLMIGVGFSFSVFGLVMIIGLHFVLEIMIGFIATF